MSPVTYEEKCSCGATVQITAPDWYQGDHALSRWLKAHEPCRSKATTLETVNTPAGQAPSDGGGNG